MQVLAKALCEKLEPESIKDVETALAGLRSDKLRAQRAEAAASKKGAVTMLLRRVSVARRRGPAQ